MNESKKPVHKIRMGSLSASIWRYEVGEQKRIRHGVTFQKSYRKDDKWENSTIFNREDLLLLAKVADLAHTWIFENSERKDDDPPPTVEAPPF